MLILIDSGGGYTAAASCEICQSQTEVNFLFRGSITGRALANFFEKQVKN